MVMKRRTSSLLHVVVLLVALLLIPVMLGNHFFRLDLTSEKRYSLSPLTKRILGTLHSPVTVELYLDGSMPPDFRRLRIASKEMLDELESWSDGMLHVKIIDPSGDDPAKNEAQVTLLMKRGLEPLNLQIKSAGGSSEHLVFPSAWVSSDQRSQGISLMQNQNQFNSAEAGTQMLNHAVESLEYTFINAIQKVSEPVEPSLGFLSVNGESSGPRLADLVHTLNGSYSTYRIDLHKQTVAELLKINVLLLVKPAVKFSEAEKYKLDQYLMYGGKLFFALDNLHAELDSMGKTGSILAYQRDLNLDDLLFRYGARVNYDLIKDLNCAQIPVLNGSTEQSSHQQLEPWLYYPLVAPVPGVALVRNIDLVRCEFVSTVDTIARRGIEKTFLLSSSPYSQVSAAPVYVSLNDIGQGADKKAFNGGRKPVAVLLEGKFSSVFTNRHIDSADLSMPFRAEGKRSSFILVSDGDVLLNQTNSLEKSIYPLGFDKYTRQVFGNKQFALNAVDYLATGGGLIHLRDKVVKLHTLDKVKAQDERLFWQLLNMLLPLAIVIVTGLVLGWVRTKRYA